MLMDSLVTPVKVEKNGFGLLQAEAGDVVNSQEELHQPVLSQID